MFHIYLSGYLGLVRFHRMCIDLGIFYKFCIYRNISRIYFLLLHNIQFYKFIINTLSSNRCITRITCHAFIWIIFIASCTICVIEACFIENTFSLKKNIICFTRFTFRWIAIITSFTLFNISTIII